MNTFTYLNHNTFVQDRNKGIGASDMPILCKQSTFMTPYELWEQKLGKSTKEIKPDLQKLFDSGHYQEPITIHRYLKEFDIKLADKVMEAMILKEPLKLGSANKSSIRNKGNGTHIYTEFKHPKYPFMYCHPV